MMSTNDVHLLFSKYARVSLGDGLRDFCKKKSLVMTQEAAGRYWKVCKSHIQVNECFNLMPKEVNAKDMALLLTSLQCDYKDKRYLYNLLLMFYSELEKQGLNFNIMNDVILPFDGDLDMAVWSQSELRGLLKSLSGNISRFFVILTLATGVNLRDILDIGEKNFSGGTFVFNGNKYDISYMEGELTRHIDVFGKFLGNRNLNYNSEKGLLYGIQNMTLKEKGYWLKPYLEDRCRRIGIIDCPYVHNVLFRPGIKYEKDIIQMLISEEC